MDYIGFNGSATSFNLLADLRFKDADGSHYVGFQAPSSVGTNLVWTLPASDGAANTVLKTAGDGTLSFAEITNDFVASNAAIAGTKISPDFGSQNIVTTGTAATGALGVTGNIAVSGTVDGVDIAARDTLFGGLTSSSGVLTDGVSATTQTSSDNTTKVATTAYVTTAVNNLINGAPAALDTLNELAAAMNDDAAFSTTVTNNLATKLALAGGQMTGNITFSGSQTVDGRDLSVDGAKLDGGIMLADGDKGDITVSNSGATFTIDNDAVTTAKIADDAVTSAKILANNVTTSEIADDAVTSAKIADGTIIAGNLANEAVQTLKIADNSVTSSKIADGTILNIDINASAAIAGTKISPDFGSQNIVTTGTAATGALGVTGNIAVSGTVDGVDIATRDTLFGGLTASSGVLTDGVTATSQSATDNTTKVATTAFTQSAISNATITGSQISTNAISTTKIADDAVTSAKIADDAITTAKLAADAVTASELSNNIVDDNKLTANAVITSKIADDAVTAAKIADDAVGADQLASNSVVSASIVDGAIVNADINASAAIAGTKISPDFGTQNIVTNGTLNSNDISTGGDVNISSSNPKIKLIDTNGAPDYHIHCEGGALFFDESDGTNRLKINSDGHVDVVGNLDVGAGIDVTGNITVTGTVDGVDIATRDTLFGGLTASSGVLTDGVTATTQSASDNSTKVATTAYVDSATSGGGTTINTNADNRVITGSDTSNTLNGESNLTFNGTTLAVTGFISCTQNLSVSGQASISSNLNVMGNIDLGNSSTDTISFGGRVDTDIIPLDDSDEDLGSSSLRWQNIYGDNLYSALVEVEGGILNVKNTGSQSEVRLYCESSNAHYAAVQAPAHSVFSGNVTLTLPAAAGNQSLVGTTETQTLTNKTLTSAVLNTGVSGSAILDEDNMASNSATQLATQQSIKAYVDANAGGGGGSPGGSNTQVQFNNSGSFGGSSNLTFDGTNLTVGGTITATSAASSANGIRKITASTSAPSGGSDGDVWIKYTA